MVYSSRLHGIFAVYNTTVNINDQTTEKGKGGNLHQVCTLRLANPTLWGHTLRSVVYNSRLDGCIAFYNTTAYLHDIESRSRPLHLQLPV